MKKIAYLSGGPYVASAIFRKGFWRLLQERGHQVEVFESHPGRYEDWRWVGWRASQSIKRWVRSFQIRSIRKRNFDTVVLETGLFHTDDCSFERNLRASCKRMVYDIDDAVFLLFPQKIAEIASMSDHVIAGNQAIADWIRPHNDSITVLPTCVDQQEYRSKWESQEDHPTDSDSKPLTVGWIGSSGNIGLLQTVLPTIAKLNEITPTHLRVLTTPSVFGSLTGPGSELVQWKDMHAFDQAAELRRFDIGIMPLPSDDEWSKYKCNAKMIQFMSSGLPTVASDVGFNRSLVQQGINGFLASTHEHWLEHLKSLSESASLREQIGKAARQTAVNGFTVQSQIERFETAILRT